MVRSEEKAAQEIERLRFLLREACLDEYDEEREDDTDEDELDELAVCGDVKRDDEELEPRVKVDAGHSEDDTNSDYHSGDEDGASEEEE